MPHFSTKVPKKDNRERKTCVSSFPIVFCFFEALIFGCKFGCKPCKLLNINIFCGAGGIRTHVQTRKPYAFYMLIPDFDFRATARPGPPTGALSPEISPPLRSQEWLFPICLRRFAHKIRNYIHGATSRSPTL